MEQLPEYLKPLYEILLNEHTELEKQLSKNGRGNSVTASKQAVVYHSEPCTQYTVYTSLSCVFIIDFFVAFLSSKTSFKN